LFGSSNKEKNAKNNSGSDSEEDVRSCYSVCSDELDDDLNLSGEEDNSNVMEKRI